MQVWSVTVLFPKRCARSKSSIDFGSLAICLYKLQDVHCIYIYMSLWVLIDCQKSESKTSPGSEAKTMILEPVFTKQHSKSPRAAEIATPVDRFLDLKLYVEWISSIATVIPALEEAVFVQCAAGGTANVQELSYLRKTTTDNQQKVV